MAGMSGAASPLMAGGNGAFTRLAREQYSALAHLRWRMFVNGLRSSQGTLELGARTIVAVIFSLFGLAVAAGLGAATFGIASSSNWQFLPFIFWVLFAMWQLVPMTPALYSQQFEMGALLRFPVSFGSFYLLHLIFGLIDASTIMGGFCSMGIWIGLTLARPDLSAWSAIALLLFAAFNILLVRAIFTWVERWLAQRRTREIAMAVFFVGILSLQLLNPGLRHHPDGPEFTQQQREQGLRWIQKFDAVQQWLPPGLAAGTVRRAQARNPGEGLLALAGLGCFALATGAVLGARLRAEYCGENLGEAPARAKAERRTGKWLIDGSGPVAAVLEKELRVMMRAIPLLYQVAAPILVVFVLASVNRNRGAGLPHIKLGLMLSLAYAVVGFTQLIYNNLGGEGAGIQLIFLSPTPIRTVMMAKNLFHALLLVVVAVLVGIVACFRLGTPPPDAIVASAAWLVFALPLHLGVGNIVSITMPYKINLGRIGRQKGSQANALLSLLVQLGALIVGGGIFSLCAWFDRLWLAVPIFLLMAGGSVAVWMRLLSNVDRLANERREELMTALMKAD